MKSLRAALLTVAFAACSAAPTEGPSAVPAPASSSVTVIETRRTFEQEQAALAKRRSVVATGEITALEAAGNRVTWAELAGTELKLHSLEDGVAATLDYDFPAGDLFHVSRALVVTEQAIGDGILFRAFDPASKGVELATLSVPAPARGRLPFAVDGTEIFYASQGEGATLYRWSLAGEPTPVALFRIDELIPGAGDVSSLTVHDGRAVLIEGGRAWSVMLDTLVATSLRNGEPALGEITFNEETALVRSAHTTTCFKFATGEAIDLRAALERKELKLAGAPSRAQRLAGESSLSGRSIHYVGERGVFEYDLITEKLNPLILTGAEEEVRFHLPRAATTEALFLVGVDADGGGSLYRVAMRRPTANGADQLR